jgi:hypothetical protein
MKKTDFKLSLDELYQLKVPLPEASIFSKIPKTSVEYEGQKDLEVWWVQPTDSLKDIKDLKYSYPHSNEFAVSNPRKIIVMPKELIWLKFWSSKVKVIDENLWMPLIEVYAIKENMTFYVKPKAITQLKTGNDINEDLKQDLENLKKSLLTKLKSNK